MSYDDFDKIQGQIEKNRREQERIKQEKEEQEKRRKEEEEAPGMRGGTLEIEDLDAWINLAETIKGFDSQIGKEDTEKERIKKEKEAQELRRKE